MISKGDWKVVESINHFHVMTGKNDSVTVANCFQNESNAILISEAKNMYADLWQINRHLADLDLPEELKTSIKQLVIKIRKHAKERSSN